MITRPLGLAGLLLGMVLIAGPPLPNAEAAIPLACDDPVSAHLTLPTSTDAYSFSAAEGEMDELGFRKFDPSGISFNPMWRVVDKDGVPYVGWNESISYDIGPLPAAGNPYRVEVEDNGHDGTGTYRLELHRLSAPMTCGGIPIACDVPYTGAIENEVDADLMTFTAAEGEMVELDFVRISPAGLRFDPIWRVLDKNGLSFLGWMASGGYDIGPLTATGSPYSIEVQDSGLDDTGSYRLDLHRLTAGWACESTPLVCGVTGSGVIDDRVDSDLYAFGAADGEIVEVGFGRIAPSGLSFDPGWRVLDKAGLTVIGWNGYDRIDFGPLNAAASPYRIEVEDFGLDDTGGYRLHLERLTAAQACGRDRMPYQVAVSRRLDDAFDGDLLAFNALSGQSLRLFINPVDPSDIRFDPLWRLLDKDGAVVMNYTYYTQTDIGALLTTGNPYRVEVVDGSSDATGTYSMSLNGIDPVGVDHGPAPPPLAMAVLVAPNPLVGRATVEFVLPEPGRAQVQLFDVGGRLQATLIDADLPSGRHRTTWDAHGVAGGLYYCRLTARGGSVTRRAIVLN